MKAFFRRKDSQTFRRETLVKESLTSQLMVSIKDLQLDLAHSEDKEEANLTNEATNSFCTILEAIFIHGLRKKLADRITSAIADPDQRPTPDFWSPLMVFSHKNIITQINKMSQITTDIGRCRAWIRLVLNDGLLLSYLEVISQQNHVLNPYYIPMAFLRDTERLGIAKNFLEGLTTLKFSLPTNSSILNVWTNTPLLMAGLWTAPMKSCPALTGFDVAKTLFLDNASSSKEDTASVLSLASYQESLSGSQKLLMDEDEALKIILGTPIEGSPLQSRLNLSMPEQESSTDKQLKSSPDSAPNLDEDSSEKPTNSEALFQALEQNSIAEEIVPVQENVVAPAKDNEMLKKSDPPKPPNVDNQSYQSLLQSYNPDVGMYNKTPDLKDFIQQYQAFQSTSPSSQLSDEDQMLQMGFEVVSETSICKISVPDFKNMVEHLSKIMQEPGLDSQNYSCVECKQPIGISIAKARVCALTGCYYCEECFLCNEWIIPSRILHNWDFNRYEVSGKAAVFLDEVQLHPLLDIRRINPRLYLAVEDMSVIQKLRLQLNLLKGYLMTCREPVIKKLQKQVWPREYLYEHVHLYSIADLVEISTGSLAMFLQKIIKFAQDHVTTCCLCSQKGFICEICQDPKVIYPFDLDISHRCLLCKGVFHINCKKKEADCPKCKRIKERREKMMLDDTDC